MEEVNIQLTWLVRRFVSAAFVEVMRLDQLLWDASLGVDFSFVRQFD